MTYILVNSCFLGKLFIAAYIWPSLIIVNISMSHLRVHSINKVSKKSIPTVTIDDDDTPNKR